MNIKKKVKNTCVSKFMCRINEKNKQFKNAMYVRTQSYTKKKFWLKQFGFTTKIIISKINI